MQESTCATKTSPLCMKNLWGQRQFDCSIRCAPCQTPRKANACEEVKYTRPRSCHHWRAKHGAHCANVLATRDKRNEARALVWRNPARSELVHGRQRDPLGNAHPDADGDQCRQRGSRGDRGERGRKRPEEDATAEDRLATVRFARPPPQHLRAGICIQQQRTCGKAHVRVNLWPMWMYIVGAKDGDRNGAQPMKKLLRMKPVVLSL